MVPDMRLLLALNLLTAAGVSGSPADFRALIHQGQESLAKADVLTAEKFFRQACGEAGDESFTPSMRASCEHHLAIVEEARGNLDSARTRLLRAMAEWQRAGDGYGPSRVMSVLNLGELYRKQGRFHDAEECLSNAVSIARDVRATYPQIYPEALTRLGGLYAETDRSEVARPMLQDAVNLFQGLSPRESQEEARALDLLGMVETLEGQNKQAESHLTEAVRLSTISGGPNHPETAAFEADLAMELIRTGQYDWAEPVLKRAHAVIESQAVVDIGRLANALAGLSILACGQNKFALAADYGRQALETLARKPGASPASSILMRVDLGSAWLRQHRLPEAERILPDAIADGRTVAPNSSVLAYGLRQLAALRAMERSWRDSGALYRESIEIYQNRLGPNSPRLVPVLREYKDVLRHSGASKAEEKTVDARLKAILSQTPRT
jgi:tetratricopeptide (TPR) repeat protein